MSCSVTRSINSRVRVPIFLFLKSALKNTRRRWRFWALDLDLAFRWAGLCDAWEAFGKPALTTAAFLHPSSS